MEGYLLDLDGTLYVGDAPLPGAIQAIERLAAAGIPTRYLTNTTRTSREGLAARLREMGFPLSQEEIFTAPRAAAAWMGASGIRRVSLHLPEATRADFEDFELVESGAEAVVVGDLGEEWTFARLNQAFRQLLGGARLVALQKNRYWKTVDGLSLDAGPFVAALEYAAGVEAMVVGKPAAEFFHLAARSMGLEPERITVVGDDLESDVGGAQAAGMRGVLVRTGKYRDDLLVASAIRPDDVADDLAAALRSV